jgi:hypothetical protein
VITSSLGGIWVRPERTMLRAAGLMGGVVSSFSAGTAMLLMQCSQIPDAYVMGCSHVLQVQIVAAGARPNLKSKLDRVVEHPLGSCI